MANGVSVSNDGNGDGIVSCENGNKVKELALNDVLLVPELETSLVSISRLVKQEMTVVFDIDGAGIYKHDQLIAEADHVNGLFKLKRTEHSLLATTNTHRENCQHHQSFWSS